MIVHGIPGDYVLEEGDIISIDCGAIIEGYHGDAAFTMPASATISRRGREAASRSPSESLWAGIEPDAWTATASPTSATPCRRWPRAPGSRWCGSTSATPSARPCTRSPRSPTTASPGTGLKLRVGHVFAVEPMVNAGRPRHPAPRRRLDAWSPPTARLSAHFEHTIAITDDGPEVLTGLA